MAGVFGTQGAVGAEAKETAARLGLSQLEQAIRACDPAVRLVLPRVLRRVIREHAQVGGWGWRLPHRKSYVLDRDALLRIVEPGELGGSAGEPLPERVILLPRPTTEQLAETPSGEILTRYWRLLFHARVHVAFEERIAAGSLSPADLRRRISQIGPTAFDEIRAVLQQENFLLPPRDDQTVYVEFAAVYLELRLFAVSFLPRYFPSIENVMAVDSVLAQDLAVDGLFRAARPAGAPEPKDILEPQELDNWAALPESGDEPETRDEPVESPRTPSEARYQRLIASAEKAAALGNVVRSAMLRAKAERFAPRKVLGRTRAGLVRDIDQLARRLAAALEIDDTAFPWRDALIALARRAPRALWTVEARLLYDLQKVCVDFEREIHTVDLVEWFLSWGRRPIKRPLASQRDILMSKHLRSAARRLAAAGISEKQRQQLTTLILAGIKRTETRIREQFRPQIGAALDAVGLVPQNLPERVARKKLIEELLDRIVERGFLALGDFRDALSRNNLKLPDVTRPADFWRGDQLLRADRLLSTSLDGVYRQGEIYLRWMQRFISLAFGTRTGRLLMRYLAVPFGGAYVALAGMDHLLEMIHGPDDIDLKSFEIVFPVGLFLLWLINVEAFRRGVWKALKSVYHGLYTALVEWPLRFLRLPWVQRILRSPLVVMGFRLIVKPLVVTALIWPILPGLVKTWQGSAGRAVLLFLGINLLVNSRAGRNLEEMLVDWTVQTWQRFGLRLLVNLFSLVMEISKEVLEAFERLLYTVDEWLRFKSGESRFTFGLKAGLGLVWFLVAYVVRFCVNVLIEPQINPIKHFPVVTVSHKLLLPFIPTFAGILEYTMDEKLAWTAATVVITSIPGVFGFLVWELKENWRLYAANRPERLGPVMIGSHGETMPRLLKRGFHSGTLPKRFAKLRRAERNARLKGNWKAVRKHLHALHHVELSIRRYVERELVELLAESGPWQGIPLRVEEIHLGPNVVRIVLASPAFEGEPLTVVFEVRSGWLLAGGARTSWADRLTPEQHCILADGLVGLYKTAGTELVREQLDAVLPPPSTYSFCEQGLVVWPSHAFDAEVLYNLGEEVAILTTQTIVGAPSHALPTLERSQVVFHEMPVTWLRWVQVWERDPAREDGLQESLVPLAVLPDSPRKAVVPVVLTQETPLRPVTKGG